MWRRWQKSRRQRQTTALNHRISRGSIETAIPSSRPERCNADARSGGQGRPKGAARRREASLTVASTAASWARRDATATRVNHHENPFTPMDVLRPRLAPNQHIQPVIAKPHPGKRCLAASRRGARPTAPSMRGFSPPLTWDEARCKSPTWPNNTEAARPRINGRADFTFGGVIARRPNLNYLPPIPPVVRSES